MQRPSILIENVSLSLDGNAGVVDILKDISIDIQEGESIGIIGPSGSYQSIPELGKLFLCAGMILGRLEIFAILVMFSPLFWKN